jgi:hypothetical protein
MYVPLSLSAQTSYSELLDQSRSLEFSRFAQLRGSFSIRVLRGREYVYFGYRDADGLGRMAYVGPNSARVQKLIAEFMAGKSPGLLQPLVRSATALGVAPVNEKHFQIIRQLSHYGFFKAGGLLIGTHAFIAMANMLGVRWVGGDKTLDVDLVHAGRNVSVALPANMKLSVHDALTSLEMGLLPIPKDPELRIDFVTSLSRGAGNVQMSQLGLAFAPLKFMEFSLIQTTQAVLMGRSDACIVNIPAPERYAIHKLIVFGERPIAERTKSTKDIEQAAAIFKWLLDTNQSDLIAQAWDDAWSRGPGWQKRLKQGWAALYERHSDLSFAR